MSDDEGPLDRGGDDVTTGVEKAEPTDLQSMLADAEAEASEAEAAAAAARARARAMRLEQEGDEADKADAVETKGRLRRPQRSTIARVVAVMVIVGCLVVSGLIAWQHHNVSVRQQHADVFVDTAKQSVVDLTSIDFKTVKDQVKHIIDNATGSFKEDFTARADQFVKVAEASKAVGKGSVSAAAVESMKTAPRPWWQWMRSPRNDEAVVLVVGSEEISNAAGNQQPRSFRFRVTVTKDGDQLKVSKLELVL